MMPRASRWFRLAGHRVTGTVIRRSGTVLLPGWVIGLRLGSTGNRTMVTLKPLNAGGSERPLCQTRTRSEGDGDNNGGTGLYHHHASA
eukprot:550508-Hanusia_phi.AAC.2